ncbi:hypothetical protein CSM81_24145 [Salmonella enterica subsp. enterica serovar Infantis]|nr:hypothetical protein [Salmonella enterica subsp. enterica serovar Infantis]
MTDSDRSISFPLYQSLSDLRSSIDALHCAASLVPVGGDDESMGCLFRVLAERLQGDLAAVFSSLLVPEPQIVKR